MTQQFLKRFHHIYKKIEDEFHDDDTPTNISKGRPITNPIKNK
jgi:hypothetical protein